MPGDDGQAHLDDDLDPARRRQVEAMAGFGIPVEAIATVLQVDADLLRRCCEHELASAAIKANARDSKARVSR